MPGPRTWLASVGWLALGAAAASAQGVAFVPTVGYFSNGATMSVTPVVSADRRYVRMTLNPQFTGLEGFTNYAVPAAVSGGGVGGGMGGGGLGGIVGFAGLNGPMVGDDSAMFMPPVDDPFAGRGLPRRLGQASAASGDFEDQSWPQASAAPAPRPRAGAVAPKVTRRRKAQAAKPKTSAAAKRPAADSAAVH